VMQHLLSKDVLYQPMKVRQRMSAWCAQQQCIRIRSSCMAPGVGGAWCILAAVYLTCSIGAVYPLARGILAVRQLQSAQQYVGYCMAANSPPLDEPP
jgi:hypothetical protein